MIAPIERPLTEDERRDLSARLANARRESTLALVKTAGAGALVCGVLALLTFLASDAPRLVITAFWTAIWLVLTAWIGLPWRRLMRGQVDVLADALRASRAREIRLQSNRVVEFEEEEDEGACYAFEHDPASSIFVVGQEFYEDDDFPNSDFSMVEILGTHGKPADVLLVKRGTKLHPERVIPAAVKNRLELPETLAVVPAPLERIEEALPRQRTRTKREY
jgi:hypothetical protein